MLIKLTKTCTATKDHYLHALSQWETMLQCNIISHWLKAYTTWSLYHIEYKNGKCGISIKFCTHKRHPMLAERWNIGSFMANLENRPLTIIQNNDKPHGSHKLLIQNSYTVKHNVIRKLGWGLLKLRSSISPLAKFSILQKCLLHSLNHIHIWQVSPQLSCGNTCQIWTSYSIANMYFGDVQILGKKRNGGNRLSNPHPRSGHLSLVIIWACVHVYQYCYYPLQNFSSENFFLKDPTGSMKNVFEVVSSYLLYSRFSASLHRD